MAKVSAPGKVHLIGEHAVVYGEPAIITAVGLRLAVEGKKSDIVRISGSRMHRDIEWSVSETIEFADTCRMLWEEGNITKDFSGVFEMIKGGIFKKAVIGTALKEFGIDSGIDLRISKSDIPVGSGLGSSSAVAAVMVKAIADTYGIDVSTEKINDIVFKCEQFAHGTPSGGDNTAVVHGGLVWFEKNMGGGPNKIVSLHDEIPDKLDGFVLAYIKKPEKSTGELVSMVRRIDPSVRDPVIKAIGEAAKEMRVALKKRDSEKIKSLMNTAWDNLSALGLSIPEADTLIAKIKEAGGAAKLCGACGGGMMLAYHENPEVIRKIIEDAGYEPMEVELGVDGVKRED